MGQQLQSWRSGDGDRLWLSMLVAAMEKASDPDLAGPPCSAAVLASVQAQLAVAASQPCGSPYSLRN